MKKKQGNWPLRKAGKKKGNDWWNWKGQKMMHGNRLYQEERTRQKEKGSPIRYLVYAIVLAIVLIVVAWFSLNVTVTNVSPGNALPFTTNYGVSFPEGQTITVGNTHINVPQYQNQLISDIDGDRQKLVVGEDRIIAERRAVITTLGAITLLDTNFKIDLKYKGERDNRAYFDMAVHTRGRFRIFFLSSYFLQRSMPVQSEQTVKRNT